MTRQTLMSSLEEYRADKNVDVQTFLPRYLIDQMGEDKTAFVGQALDKILPEIEKIEPFNLKVKCGDGVVRRYKITREQNDRLDKLAEAWGKPKGTMLRLILLLETNNVP